MERANLPTVAERTFRPASEGSFSTRLSQSLFAHRTAILLFVMALTFMTVLHHTFLAKYQAQAALLVQRAENSPLQAMMGKMTGNASLGTKRNEYLEKYYQYLNSHEFYLQAARRMTASPNFVTELKPLAPTRAFLSRVSRWLKSIFYLKPSDPSSDANVIEELAVRLRANAAFIKTTQDVLTVQVAASDFHEAVRNANFLAETAVKVITETELKELIAAKNYISSEQEAAVRRLEGFDSAIIDYRRKNQLIKSDSSATELIAQVADLKKNLEINRLKYNQNERLIALLSTELQKQEKKFFDKGASQIPNSQVINQLREQMQSLRYKKMLLQSQGVTDSANQLQVLNAQIDNVGQRIRERIESQGGTQEDVTYSLADDRESVVGKISALQRENQYLTTSIETLAKALATAVLPLDELPNAQQKMVGFNRNTQLEFILLQEMRKKSLEIELERVALDSKIRVLEQATVAGIPARLNLIPKVAFAAMIGFLLAATGGYLADEFSSTIKGRKELTDLGMVVIGSIPRVTSVSGRTFFPRTARWVEIIAAWRGTREWPESMAFKHVRTTLLKMNKPNGQPAKTICVLGATPGDGKSFISANVAMALAQQGKKTLIIDCDLRRPSLGDWFSIDSSIGVTSFLSDKKPIKDCIYYNIQPNLDVMAAGHSVKHATELFTGGEVSTMLSSLEANYDYIVIDTPPLLSVADGLLLSALSDIVLFSVSHRKTKFADIEHAIETFRRFDDRPLFAVYNRVEGISQYNYLYTNSRKKRSSFSTELGSNLRGEIAAFRKNWRKVTPEPTPNETV